MEGLGADSEEKREPVSDIDTVAVDSLKALDPNRPIREADMSRAGRRTSSVETDPNRKWSSPFCCDAQSSHSSMW